MLDTDLYWPIELCSGESNDQLLNLTLDALGESADLDDRHFVPDDLEGLAPGPFLAAILSNINLSRLTGRDVVRMLKAQRRQVSSDQAGIYRAIAETAHCTDADTTDRCTAPDEFAAEEIGAALSYTRRKAERELFVALSLKEHPQMLSALNSGSIDSQKAVLIATDTDHLDRGSTGQIVDRVLPHADELTTGQLRARIRRLCIQIDPDTATKRMKRSLEERKVVAEPNREGTAALVISECSPDDVFAARDHINMLARRLKTAEEPRNIDQLRADVALDLLSGTIGEPRRGAVDIHVDLKTLAELAEESGELAGYGPVVAEIARKVADEQRSASWTATATNPETGEPMHVVSVRRRPTARQFRKVKALHPTCAFVGCRMPAADCDIDHIVDFARGGRTLVANHAPLCRHHHRAKHKGGWRYSKINKRQTEWISPLGHTYQTRPPP